MSSIMMLSKYNARTNRRSNTYLAVLGGHGVQAVLMVQVDRDHPCIDQGKWDQQEDPLHLVNIFKVDHKRPAGSTFNNIYTL